MAALLLEAVVAMRVDVGHGEADAGPRKRSQRSKDVHSPRILRAKPVVERGGSL